MSIGKMLDNNDTDAIKRDQHYQTQDCRTEMLGQFLRNNRYELFLNDLHKFVRRVNNKHTIQENSDETK